MMKLLKIAISTMTFLARNLRIAKDIPAMSKGEFKDLEFCPCTRDLVPYIANLYKESHSGEELGVAKKTLLKLAGHKLCLVVRDKKTNQIVGYSLYYFNRRDIREATIHEGDISLHSDYRGKGIGTAQRLHVLRHFARCPSIKGLSSRIDLDNQASLRSGQKVGYKIKECYFDQSRGKERAYLICDLAPYRECNTNEEQERTLPRRKDELN